VLSAGSTYTEEFPALPESVPRARTAVEGFALAAGAADEQLDNIRLAASEAVTNAVLHAYRGMSGSFQVTASYIPDELWLLVGDDGCGLGSGSDRGGLGLGLAVIAQVTDGFQIIRRANGGTEVQMRFRLRVAEPGRTAEEGRPDPASVSPA
jgi:anti-sigma regulatory factor (Ser/Thr protein kinase)